MGQTVLDVSGVTKTYGGFTAVDDVSFTVDAGSVFGFLGPNGAGKTTTLRMILDIIQPTRGEIRILGSDSAMSVRDQIGYLPEERGLYKKMTARQTIAYFGQLKGLSGRAARQRAMELLERFGLKDFAKAKIESLSKGMAQKVQVLSAIVHDPRLVILDEPFSGLDPVNQQVLEELIQDLADRDRTIIFSTHVMQHAERLCDRLLLVAEGQRRFFGTLSEARAALPRRVRIETPDPVGPLEALEFVESVTLSDAADRESGATGTVNGHHGHAPRYEVTLRQGTDPQWVLKACFDRGITLRQFDQSDPSLHEIFVALVGPKAREAAYR
ncbi:MAG: ABC transporter ATP-binding protein [Alphaproteobacteria bacterium]